VDESTLSKVIEASNEVRKLSFKNCKIPINDIFELDDKLEYKIDTLEFSGTVNNINRLAQSLGNTKLTGLV